MRSSVRSYFLVLIFVLLCGPALSRGQDTRNGTAIGLPENGAFSGSNFDNVQITNGNLHIEIPLWSLPQRGAVPVSQKLVYDNKGWYRKETCSHIGVCSAIPQPEQGNNMKWTLGSSWITGTFTYQTEYRTCPGGAQEVLRTGRIFRESDGTKHHMLPDPVHYTGASCSGAPADGGAAYAEDGSGWMRTASGTMIRKDGMVSGRDTNGNYVSGTTDTLGRTIYPTVSNIAYADSNGVVRQIQITYQTVPVHTPWSECADTCSQYVANWTVPYLITLPNGLTYTFSYRQNEAGELESVTLPTGGQIVWTWAYFSTDKSGRYVSSRTVTSDGQTSLWEYTYTLTNGYPSSVVVKAPPDSAGQRSETKTTMTALTSVFQDVGTLSTAAYPTKVEIYQGSVATGTKLKTIQTDYSTTGTRVPIRVTTTLNDTNQVTKVETDWDGYSVWSGTITWKNPIQLREYAYGTGVPGVLLRKRTYAYLHQTNSTYRGLNIADRLTTTVLYDGAGAIKAQTQYTYDGSTIISTTGAPNHDAAFGSTYTTRGNPTQVRRWLNTTGLWLATNNTYDDLGNLRSSTDPLGHPTSFTYDDNWANSACATGGTNTQAYLTQKTNALGQREQARYLPCTGLTNAARDENDILASRWGKTLTYDLMLRIAKVVKADGSQTDWNYNGDVLPLTVTSTTKITGSTSLVTTTVHDGRGRVVHTELTDPEGNVKTETTYDLLGRVAAATNPYRSTSELTYGIKTTSYDALERVTSETAPDGSVTFSTYVGSCTTVTDPATKKRKLCNDALNRLIQVFEDPNGLNYETGYQYDVFDNVTQVDQKGGSSNPADWRTRTFTYDSQERLLVSVNPETGTINYTYDDDGNLITKDSPQPNQTSGAVRQYIDYCYDSLERMTKKYYRTSGARNCNLGGAAVIFAYDETSASGLTIQNGVNRRTSMSDASGTAAWTFDPSGRPLTERRTIVSGSAITKDITISYNLSGSLASITYPSGRRIEYGYNSAGRAVTARDPVNSIDLASCPAPSVCYAPQGGLKYLALGATAGITWSIDYNNRLQPTLVQASTSTQTILNLSYTYGSGGTNNGNILQMTNNLDGVRPGRPNGSLQLTYDALNRIASQHTTAATPDCTVTPSGLTKDWGQTFSIDAWGNLYDISTERCSTPTLHASTNSINNRLTGLTGVQYDAAGNMVNDGTHGLITYDEENRILTVSGVTYTYDGDGERVKKSSGSIYWGIYNNQPLAESDTSGNIQREFVFFNGKRLARLDGTGPSPTVYFYFSDHLGSASVVTNAAGGIVEESDYYAFGGERVITDLLSNQNYKFTGRERDPESSYDYFPARYYTSSMGRWLTPDWAARPSGVPYAVFGDPQSLNLYGYVGNNPFNRTDADGHLGMVGDAMDYDKGIGFGGMDAVDLLSKMQVTASQQAARAARQNGKPPQPQKPPAKKQDSQQKKPSEPACQAQMRSRPGDATAAQTRFGSFGFSHAWWYVVDDTGQDWTLSFTGEHWKADTVSTPLGNVPTGTVSGSLNAYATKGTQSSSNAGDNQNTGQIISDTGRTPDACTGVGKMIQTVQTFPVDKVPYGVGAGQATSNSGARYLGQVGGFNPKEPNQPGLKAAGWSNKISGIEK
jgi:RHS repeat-associated protein